VSAAFLTGALAAGFAGGALAALVIWIVTLVSGSTDPWRSAPIVVAAVAALLAIATYAAERIVYRRSMQHKRATGEPWAYRQD
jgi:uncharacterized membrane protein YebE (DUF533 family)